MSSSEKQEKEAGRANSRKNVSTSLPKHVKDFIKTLSPDVQKHVRWAEENGLLEPDVQGRIGPIPTEGSVNFYPFDFDKFIAEINDVNRKLGWDDDRNGNNYITETIPLEDNSENREKAVSNHQQYEHQTGDFKVPPLEEFERNAKKAIMDAGHWFPYCPVIMWYLSKHFVRATSAMSRALTLLVLIDAEEYFRNKKKLKNGRFWQSDKEIAARIPFKKHRIIRECIEDLDKLKLIKIISRGKHHGNATTYEINHSKLHEIFTKYEIAKIESEQI